MAELTALAGIRSRNCSFMLELTVKQGPAIGHWGQLATEGNGSQHALAWLGLRALSLGPSRLTLSLVVPLTHSIPQPQL
jgi:hypothetical protein